MYSSFKTHGKISEASVSSSARPKHDVWQCLEMQINQRGVGGVVIGGLCVGYPEEPGGRCLE